MMIGADQGLRLELVNQRVGAIELPLGVGLVPPAVEPDATDVAVAAEQLAQLSVHVLDVSRPGPFARPAGIEARAAAGKVIRMMPIELRVVEKQLDALLPAFVGKRLEDVFLVGRARDDVVVGDM